MSEQNWLELGDKYVMNTYKRFPITIESADGCYVTDTNGKKYLDFVSGIAVNTLGYNNKDFISSLTDQIGKLIHISNLYWNKPQIELAKCLVENSIFDKVFFCNSGAEAIEGILKLCRKYGKKYKGDDCFEIITIKQSFHGRTYGAITATGQDKYQEGLTPLLPGIKYAEFNDIESLKEQVTGNTCVIILEPIQGEGGIRPVSKEYLQEVRKICDENNIVLAYDEIQCGMGRTGYLFAYEYYDVAPDVIALAKGLGGGCPIGAILAIENVAQAFQPGDHASTFGGNALACSAGLTVLDFLLNKNILKSTWEIGEYLSECLQNLKKEKKCIKDIRGVGLMQGIEIDKPAADVVLECLNNGLLLVGAGSNVIRFVPPLIINKEEVDKAIAILKETL